MRYLLLAAGLAAMTAAAQGETWIAVCLDQDVQFIQTIDEPGFFHVANPNGTYDTQKLVQTFHNDDMVCAVADPKAPQALSEVAEVCMSKSKKTISAILKSETGVALTPQNAKAFCKARISVY